MEKNPRAIFEIDGLAWDSRGNEKLFQRVTADLGTGDASMATWQLIDPHFRIIDRYAGVADGGASLPVIRVWMGFGDDLGEPLFKGLLARVERGESSTTFRAYDMSYRMRQVKKARHKLKGTGLQIIGTLARQSGLKFQGPAKPLKLEPHKAMMQDEQTDWEFASEIAHEEGLLLWCRHDTLFADYPAKVGKPKVTLAIKRDFTILRSFDFAFKVPENKGGRPRGVEVRGRGRGGKRLKGTSDRSQRGHEDLQIKKDLPIHSKQRATARAQAQRELDREHAFEISVSVLPTAPDTRVDVRDTVRLLEAGKLFSGDYIADRVGYELGPGKLSRTLELYRDVKEK